MISFRSTNTIYLKGPQNANTGSLSSGGTCTANLYHDDKDGYLTQNAASFATVFNVSNTSLYELGVDIITIELNNNTLQSLGLIVAIDSSLGTITTASPAGSESNKGRRIMAHLGAEIAMSTTYGTPASGTFDWGYRGDITPTHPGLKVGMPVRIEILLIDAGVEKTTILREIVTGGD
jgi:hypothetical protein